MREGARLSICIPAGYIELLPAAEKGNQAWGEAVSGPKEVTAQLVFQHELFVKQMEALQEGGSFEPPQDTQDDLNLRAVEASRVISANALAQRLRAAQARLDVLYSPLVPDQEKALGRELALEEVLEQAAGHIRRQLERLQDGRPNEENP